ncbi:anti-sigma factor family protein [Streptomyces liangshanensis]|uniref:Zinc-finger domain-containing protein n=1 Tax=Streptomyces liangshanensis TaxID=2717324 RepID=A0A6G9H0H8_9ACTN|nr:zf-HC2 domain-containing protein [Streptomyces liangshanensis]QIQ03816.1 hypothetical protein HA039_17125 [Streptomyces liangshanensis]
MTSTTDTTQHPDVSEISDLNEGLLTPSRAAEVQEHLDGCALCADVHASLEEIRGLLGTLPGPPRMPADIAGRIDAALAAEALLSATAPDQPVDVSRETTPSEPSSDTSPTTSDAAARTDHSADQPADRPVDQPVDQPADQPADRPAGRPRAATGPGRDARKRRRRLRTTVLGAVLGTAAVGVSVFLLQTLRSSDADNLSAADSGPATSSAKTLSKDTLQNQVDTLLGASPAAPDQKSFQPQQENPGADEGTVNTPLMRSAPAVPACVQRGTGRTDPALAVDQVLYQGTHAYLVVLPDPADSTKVQAYVIDAACVDTAPTGKGDVLLTHSYPRR